MKQLRKKSGFTLIELLIVMVIITILATLGLVAYSYALKNARNARRIADLNSIQAAFEQYYTANGVYVNTCGGAMANSLQGGMPTDPNTGTAYSTSSCSTTTYCVCAALEPPTGAAGSADVRGGNSGTSTCSFTSTGSDQYYCVQQKQ